MTWWLQPIYKKKSVHYIIVQNTEVDITKDEERQFVMKIFTYDKVDLDFLPKTIMQTFIDKWLKPKAGGKYIFQNGGDNKH